MLLLVPAHTLLLQWWVVGYTTNYSSAVVTDDEGEYELDSSQVCTCVAAIIENVGDAAPNTLHLPKSDGNAVAPLTVPHIFWCASTSWPDSLPSELDSLLDVGSHLVSICKQLVKDLGLHLQKLHDPIITELVMQPDGPKILKLHKFVKLKPYDCSGAYVMKTMHAVISSTLCAPILLGLPFLKHNNIMIDIEDHTVIDKHNNFDLLHLLLPSSKPLSNPEYDSTMKPTKIS